MRRWWVVAALMVGLAGAAAWEVRPGRWAAAHLATQVAQQMAAGDVTSLVHEAVPALAPLMNGHLAAAIAPLHGAAVRDVRLVQCSGGAAEASIRYTDGRTADVRMSSPGGTRWQIAGLT